MKKPSAFKNNSQTSSAAVRSFFAENREKILSFGEYFLQKLSDIELLDNLAEKDLEKLARIFKLMFEKGFASDDKQGGEQNQVLNEILEIFKKEGDKPID